MEDATEKAPHIQNEADSLLGEGQDQVIIPSLLSVDPMKVNLLSVVPSVASLCGLDKVGK
jgi:hypothetical protein